MGEEQKEEEKKEEPPKEEEPPAPPEIVLKVDMHCAGCARKVQKSLRRFEGVEEVKADNIAKTVVVKGAAADPAKICERVQKKTGRRVELLSPLPPPPPPEEEKKEDPPKEEPAPPEENKEEPKPITVVLKIRMHCESCAHAITKRIKKMEGVESVETDIANDQIMVKGVFDPNVLVENVYRRTRRQPLIIPDEEKKEEKKEEEKKDEHHEELKKIEYWPPLHHIEYAYPAYPAYPAYDTYNVYQTPHVQYGSYVPPQHAHYGLYAQPQAFSDENPNACSVM